MESYVGAAGMLLHVYINGKFIIDKLKSSLLSFLTGGQTSLSISMCMSRCEADLTISVVSFISRYDQQSH